MVLDSAATKTTRTHTHTHTKCSDLNMKYQGSGHFVWPLLFRTFVGLCHKIHFAIGLPAVYSTHTHTHTIAFHSKNVIGFFLHGIEKNKYSQRRKKNHEWISHNM